MSITDRKVNSTSHLLSPEGTLQPIMSGSKRNKQRHLAAVWRHLTGSGIASGWFVLSNPTYGNVQSGNSGSHVS